MEYRFQVHKQTFYLFQYPSKIVTETGDPKTKSGVTKNDDKEILFAIANVNFENISTAARIIQEYQVNQIIARQRNQ